MKAARLVVLLSIILAQVLAIDTAIADHGECWVDGTGRYVCHYKGGGPGGGGGDPGEPGDPGQPPPLRYLQVAFEAGVGDCWQWSRTPPGFDSWDPANDAAIIITRLTLPECSSSPGRPPGEFSIDATAWEIFRSFPLSAPNAPAGTC